VYIPVDRYVDDSDMEEDPFDLIEIVHEIS
jgi:hypothetical protein